MERHDKAPAIVPDSVTPPEGVRLGKPGPWGQLETTRIVISPPLEYVPDDPFPPAPRTEWRFPRTTRAELEAFLREAGVSPGDVAQLLAGTRPDPAIHGVVVDADRRIVARLDPGARGAIYVQLAQSPLNPSQQQAVRFYGSVDEWLARSRISPATLDFVRPMTYSHEGFSLFADIDLVRSGIGDRRELRLLAKSLHRESTLAVRVRIGDPSRVEEVAAYWGRGGRRTDVRPLLESLTALGPEGSIDIAHLLPPLARLNLYRYPMVSLADLEKPSLPNCFWTALNFFDAKPNDRYLDLDVVNAALKRDYFLVHDELQLGDVVTFSAENGSYYHAAVYVADDLIFGKNGNAPLSPWTVMPIERVKGYYPQHDSGRVTYHRRKNL